MRTVYKVTALVLIVGLLGGCMAAFNSPPTARFTFSPTTGIIPLTIYFNGGESSDVDGYIISWQWDFGDGYTQYGRTVSYQFTESGTYTVTLTVEDNSGKTASCYHSVVVTSPQEIYRHYLWTYNDGVWQWDLLIPGWLYYEYQQRSRITYKQSDYYAYYILDPLDDLYLENVAQAISITQGGDYYRSLEDMLCFVQGAIGYDYLEGAGYFEYPRYPVETLVEQIGDCEDTAILYASLARTLGYGALLAILDTNHDGKADHAAALVPVDETYRATVICPNGFEKSFWEYGGQLYAFAETAVDGWYLPLGCAEPGLRVSDFVKVCDVKTMDISPKMLKVE